MKNKRTKKTFNKFSQTNARKRKNKSNAKKELMRAIAETGVGTSSLKLSDTSDFGRRGRVSRKAGRNELTGVGVFSSSKGGFGFVTLDGGERDVFIPQDKTGRAVDGDRVEIIYHVYLTREGEQRTEGRVRRIIEYGRKTLIGTVACEKYSAGRRDGFGSRFVLVPDDLKISVRPIITGGVEAKVGDKIEASLERDGAYGTECTALRNFGDTHSREANYGAVLAEYNIKTDFTAEELAEAEFFASAPLSFEGRVNREKDIVFTIDGESAKDLDDAVSLKKLKGGMWQLGVHIADVSHYVSERTHLDRAAMARGTSVYFTDKVVPMLPPLLSNGACSLNPGEYKYTLSAVIRLSPVGEILSCKVEPSVIKSRVRGVYSEVNAIFSGTADGAISEKYREVLPTLEKMHGLYTVLKKKSAARGALELETAEAEILLSPDGTPCDIVRRSRGDAEKMIEQFMLCANEAVAKLLYEKGIPCVYRVHEEPPADKLGEFLTLAHNLGFDTSVVSREKCTPKELSALLARAEERGVGTTVSYMLLRSMAKAKYSSSKAAHFGLGIDCYCHFTSPIRRLSDLATHRIIHRVLLEGKRPDTYAAYAYRAASAATDAELRALGAERRIENLYKVLYMESCVGCEFDAVVSSVTSFGLFAELENTCEGLVPISELPGVFTFDEKNLSLRSRRVTYRLGERIRVRLEEADIIRGKLRFSLADTHGHRAE